MTTKKDVLGFFSAEDEKQCERYVYKYTDCGAWIEFKPWGIILGSIVEGCDFGTVTYPLRYKDKFTHKDIQDRINAIEAEASALWDWANTLVDKTGRRNPNGKPWSEYGVDAPDIERDYSHFEQGERSS